MAGDEPGGKQRGGGCLRAGVPRILHDAATLSAIALVVASIDHVAGLMRLWFSPANVAQESQAFALAAASFFGISLFLGLVARLVTGARRPGHGWLDLSPVVLALPAAFLAGLFAGRPMAPDASLRASMLFLLAISVPLALLLAALRRSTRSGPGTWAARLDARVNRHLVPLAFAVGSLTLGVWALRNRIPLEHQTNGRLLFAALSGAVWVAALLLMDSGWRRWLHGALLACFAFLIGAAFVSAGPLEARTPSQKREDAFAPPAGVRRILLITVDTLRADVLGAYGGTAISTPRIDQLASRGIRFAQAISPSSWTLPSVASIMTGNSVPAHGATTTSSRLPDALPTLASRLRDAGYATGAVGFNAHLATPRGLDRGFDHYDFYPRRSTPWDNWGGRLRAALRPLDHLGHVNTSQITDLSVQWMRSHRERPFFLWCHYFDPHLPYAPPQAFMPEGPVDAGIGPAFDNVQGIRTGRFKPSEDEKEWIRRLYLGEVRYVDSEVGRLLRSIAELGPAEETLIVLTSDHGEEFWEHGKFEHGHTLYQELIHVPWIITLPGRLAPTVVEEPVSVASLLPTLLKLLDLPLDPGEFTEPPLELAGTPSRDAPPVFSAGMLYAPHGEAVLHDRWKLIRTPSRDASLLFNLAADPAETDDRSALEADRLPDLRGLLDGWLANSQDVRNRLDVRDSAPLDLPEETIEHLEKLGYLD